MSLRLRTNPSQNKQSTAPSQQNWRPTQVTHRHRQISRLRRGSLAVSALSREEIVELIEALEAFAEPVEVVLKTRPLSTDPNDDMVLDVAINGEAEALVTNNTKHFADTGKRFGIAILSPAELLSKMRREAQDGD